MPESRTRKSRKAYTPPATTAAAAARKRPPSPAWYGAAILVLFAIGIIWIVGYSLGPLPGQTALGGWNYAVALVVILAAVGMLTSWR